MNNFEATSPLLFRQSEMFNILVYERRLRHRGLCNKDKLMGEFDSGYFVVVRKKVNSTIKFKTKVPYRVREKATSSSYWLQRLPFCKGLGRPRIKVN